MCIDKRPEEHQHGDYELTVYPKSLFSSDGSLLDGSKSKSEAVNEVLKYTGYDQRDKSPLNPDSVVIDAINVLKLKCFNKMLSSA